MNETANRVTGEMTRATFVPKGGIGAKAGTLVAIGQAAGSIVP